MKKIAKKFASHHDTTPAKFYKIMWWRRKGYPYATIRRELKARGIKIKYHTLYYWVKKGEKDE